MKWEDIRHLAVTYISIEPLLFFVALGKGVGSPIGNALWYSKVCLSEYPQQVCDNSTFYEDEHTWVQKTTSRWKFYETLTYVIPALLTSVIYGSWGDRLSRKAPIIIPVSGAILEYVLFILNSIFLTGPPGLLLVGSIVSGLTGGSITLLASCFGYLTEVSTLDNRTVRISVAYATNLFSYSIATFVSGLIFDTTGFVFVFSFSCCCLIIAVIYAVVYLKEFRPTPTKDASDGQCHHHVGQDIVPGSSEQVAADHGQHTEYPLAQGQYPNPSQSQGTETEQGNQPTEPENCSRESSKPEKQRVCEKCEQCHLEKAKKETWWSKVKRLFTLRHLVDGFLLVAKKRPLHKQAHFNILLFMVFYLYAINSGGITYLYLIHKGMSQEKYGYYTGYTLLIHGLCLLFVIPLMKTKLGATDTAVIMVAILSVMAGRVLMAYATEVWMFFLVPLLSSFENSIITGIRSMLSATVYQDEQGKMFALVACIECIASLCASALYSYLVYPATIDDFPGFSFMLESILLTVLFLISFGLHIDMKQLNDHTFGHSHLVEEPDKPTQEVLELGQIKPGNEEHVGTP